MAGGGNIKSNPTKSRKRVEAETSASVASLVRARDGSAFARCEECNKDVPAALIGMHSCSLDAKIKMNLEAQVVENPTEVKKRSLDRNNGEPGEPKPKRTKKEKGAAKDPNKPKRPLTAYFIFMADFRKEYKEANPDCKEPKKVAKDAGEKWKSMSEEEKKPYIEKAAQLKADFAKGSGSSNADDENREADNSGDDDNTEDAKEEDTEDSKEEDAEDSKKEDAEAEAEDESGQE
ncbi:High mobility group B protein 7 [Linum perenne]